MPSVSDELAALRSTGTVRQHATLLQSKKSGLSTPEAEEATLAALRNADKLKKAEAEELLRKTHSVRGLVEEEYRKVGDRKKEFERGRNEAKDILMRGGAKGSSLVSTSMSAPTENAEGTEGSEAKQDAARELEDTRERSDESTNNHDATQDIYDDDILDLAERDEEPTNNNDAIQDNDGEDDDDVPDLEETKNEEPSPQTNPTTATNRNEKKVRKIMSRLNMRPIPGVVRAVMKTPGGNFVIEHPDVFASGGGNKDTYVIFGEARQQQPLGLRKNAAEEAARVLKQTAKVEEDDSKVPEVEQEVDVQGLEAKDIELVMAQASCEKSVAVKALKENDGDLVNAIMSLTT